MTPFPVPADRDEYTAAMLRAADRVALAYRSECPDTITAVVQEAVTIPAPAPSSNTRRAAA